MINGSDAQRRAPKASSVPRWRRLARFIRRLPERLLHPLRRRAALSRLRNRAVPRQILLACQGNICRSPYAAAVFARKLTPELRSSTKVRSGGFIGPHRPSPAEALRVAASRGIDLSGHRSSLITPDAVQEADLVVVMDQRQRRAIHTAFGKPYQDILVLGDLDPDPITTRAIRDPFNQSEEVFLECFDRVDRCVEAVIGAVRSVGLGKL